MQYKPLEAISEEMFVLGLSMPRQLDCKDNCRQANNLIREASELKIVTKSGKSPIGGEGVSKKIKKSKIRNLDFLIRGGGDYIFIFFPNVNLDFKCFS